jgi:hypothetical protein
VARPVAHKALIRWPASLALVCAAIAASSGCSGPAAPNRPPPWWASVQKPGAMQTDAFRSVPGSSSYRCVDVGQRRNVRSGGFVAGNFGANEQDFGALYQQSRQRTAVKIYWVPLHVDHMSGLTVQATLLPSRTLVRTTRHDLVGAGGRAVFYSSGIPIPVPGTWELVATAGSNKGCFIATFR